MSDEAFAHPGAIGNIIFIPLALIMLALSLKETQYAEKI